MFQALSPLVAERNVHILLSAAADGRVAVYVEPVLKDKETGAFATPFRCEATPSELDAQLATVLGNWINSRKSTLQSLTESLAAAEAATKKAAEEAKKAAKNKTTPTLSASAKKDGKSVPAKPTVAKASVSPTPSLLDGLGTDEDEETDEAAEVAGVEPVAAVAEVAAPAPVAAAPTAAVTTQPAPAPVLQASDTPPPAPVVHVPVAPTVVQAAAEVTPTPAAPTEVIAPAVQTAVVEMEEQTISLF